MKKGKYRPKLVMTPVKNKKVILLTTLEIIVRIRTSIDLYYNFLLLIFFVY